MPLHHAANKHLRAIATVLIVLVLVIGCEGAQPTPSLVSPTAIPIQPTATPVPPTATAPPPTATPKPTVQAIVPEMVLVESGSFQMGSTDGEKNEQPVHTVHITRLFYVARYELTFDQYDQFCDETIGKNRPPDDGQGRGARPVVVTWRDAAAYCNWLSEKHGLIPCYIGKGRLTQCDFAANGYRLPTEAEWEYAARGGHLSQGYSYAGSDDVDEVAWYGGNSDGRPHPVGQKKPNELGLYDMSGNIAEWCWDWYGETYYAASPASDPTGPASGSNPGNIYGSSRVLRGSHCMEAPYFMRVTFRGADGEAYPGGGIRLVRTKPLTSSGGMIAFVSERDGNQEIYVTRADVNADGSDPQRLTDNSAPDRAPAWSPDGAQIAFVSQRDGNDEIYVMNVQDILRNENINSSALWRLTKNQDYDWAPAWSPNGTQIAFTSNRDRNDEIYIQDVPRGEGAGGSDPRRLTRTDKAQDVDPAWSPDGMLIAFVSDRDGNDEIYIMNADGAEQGSDDPRRLTHNDGDDWWPAWSPDGTQIAFTSARDGSYEIYVMAVPDGTDADGSNPHRLTHGDGDAWWPSWSPDGTQIAFQSNPDGQWDIYVMNADGTNVRRLTTSSAADRQPAWQP